MDDQPSSCHHSSDTSLETITLNVNGRDLDVQCDSRSTLLDALRDNLSLTGSKKGCDRGQCGACTVLIDERRVVSCLIFAVAAQNRRITTIEGIADLESGTDLQQAFVDHDGFQCGYCTPGQICSAVGMLDEAKRGWPSAVTPASGVDDGVLDDDEIRERLSGNICRCGAYVNILAAVRSVAGDVLAEQDAS
ncbi:MAG: (2Fe-2S)-binding protein [Gordonia sp. (in: high G+C Gram-positive bacteria)]|nr:MAG: (2Fe-2S)-binding protein [Gordonia sp. (in: high G+C Gram-positive bacteria)]